MITYQQEFLATTNTDDVMPLLREDWDEIDHPSKRDCDLDPDWDMYRLLEEKGMFKVFTARKDGELVGYFGVFITPSFHSKGSLQVVMDAVFVRKSERKSKVGFKLFRFVEKCLREDGFKSLAVTSTQSYPLDNFLIKSGYTKVETKFERPL